MYRFVAAVLLSGFVSFATSAGISNVDASSTNGADIYGVGGGKTDNGPILSVFSFDLSAHTGPSGDFGRVGVRESTFFGEVDYKVEVDCVNVTDFKTATVSGIVTRVTPVPNYRGITDGHRFFFFIQDGGEPSGSTPVDSFIPKDDPAPPADCKTIILGGAQSNVTHGNVVIKGATE